MRVVVRLKQRNGSFRSTNIALTDEDTSATNFMIRDGRMQRLIVPEKEPITPFSNRVKPLYEHHDVSTILIVGVLETTLMWQTKC